MIIAHLVGSLRFVWVSDVIPPLTRDDVLGKYPWDFVDDGQADSIKTRLSRCWCLGEPQSYTVHSTIAGKQMIFRVRAERTGDVIVLISIIVPAETVNTLTRSEITQLKLMAAGASHAVIARELRLSLSTVNRRATKILEKLEASPAMLLRKYAQSFD